MSLECRACGEAFTPRPDQYILYNLCDACFAEYDVQKMAHRLGSTEPVGWNPENVNEWIAHRPGAPTPIVESPPPAPVPPEAHDEMDPGLTAFVEEVYAALPLVRAEGVGGMLEKLFDLPELQRVGTWAEFGVAGGASLRKLAAQAGNAEVLGFDWFQGLPEAWRPGYPAGTFAQPGAPSIPGARIIQGRFEDVLPTFEISRRPLMLVHIDCDIYSGAIAALRWAKPRLVKGSIVVFDELVGYDGCEEHELRALYEADLSFRWLLCTGGEAAAIIIG